MSNSVNRYSNQGPSQQTNLPLHLDGSLNFGNNNNLLFGMNHPATTTGSTSLQRLSSNSNRENNNNKMIELMKNTHDIKEKII
jgi:hypothetical protein